MSRTFWAPPQTTSEIRVADALERPALHRDRRGKPDGRWQLRLWWKPFVTCIWLGGFLIALGGFLALVGRVSVDVRRRVATRKIAARRAEIAAA